MGGSVGNDLVSRLQALGGHRAQALLLQITSSAFLPRGLSGFTPI